jgi:hypothetical protein
VIVFFYKQTPKETIMLTRTIAVSILALGLLSPVVASAQGSNTQCDEVTNHHADYGDCSDKTYNNGSAALSAGTSVNVARDSIGDFIDETTVEKNQRSGNK